jgi:hypothetical protein
MNPELKYFNGEESKKEQISSIEGKDRSISAIYFCGPHLS